MKRVARSAIVQQRCADLYALVEDIESYPRFLPWCREAEVRERTPERTVATLTVGVKGIRQAFTTENENRPPAAIRMRLIEGPFRRFGAAWRITPLGERAAKIEFWLEYEFANRLLARALEPLFDHIADTMVDAFVRRAEEVHGKPAG
ncbi:MAG: type II toxin-antitoxin system RatA family toxin [Betaproteobacteria bacterium]|nr:type II toxin-antitoxin system RatA family toxin [Betaproteobacteria bacterium]